MPAVTHRSFADFLRESFPWALKGYVWSGNNGILPIDEDRRVVLARLGSGTHQHTAGVRAMLVSKRTGAIVAQDFNFNDYLTGRSDGRTDYPNEPFMIVEYVAMGWHVAVPAKPGKFSEAIEEWVETWR